MSFDSARINTGLAESVKYVIHWAFTADYQTEKDVRNVTSLSRPLHPLAQRLSSEEHREGVSCDVRGNEFDLGE